VDKKPIRRRTDSGSLAMEWPQTEASPALGLSMVASRRRVVVLPAPLTPSSPKISPAWASKVTLSTARISPRLRSLNVLVREVAETRTWDPDVTAWGAP
jgi:ABC-type arginine transport system permease subunit